MGDAEAMQARPISAQRVPVDAANTMQALHRGWGEQGN